MVLRITRTRYYNPEFPAWYMLQLMAGKCLHASLSQAYVDFQRSVLGRTQFSKKRLPYTAGDLIETLGLPPPDPTVKIDVERLCLSMVERVVFVLYSKWGFTQEEIADVLGKSRDVVNNIMHKVRVEMRSERDRGTKDEP